MTFNSSCSYAGLTNLLSIHGIETEDWEIALQIRLPYLFTHEDGAYLSGPMLQGARWFNLYLNPIGFTLQERQLNREEVCAYLEAGPQRMLGLRVTPVNKHAVIYTGKEKGKYRFLNNKRKDSPEPETLYLTERELLTRLDEQTVVGTLERADRISVGYQSYLKKSVLVFQNLREEIIEFCAEERSGAAMRSAMDGLFRPILLDGVTMLELLEERETVGHLKAVRGEFLRSVKGSRPVVLAKELDMEHLQTAMAQYEELIIKKMEAEQDSI